MSAPEQLRLLLDSDMSSHSLARILEDAGHDVLVAGFRDDLKQLDDPILFSFAQSEKRIMITHNVADFPDILGEWAAAGHSPDQRLRRNVEALRALVRTVPFDE